MVLKLYKIETHIHTKECDPYSSLSGCEAAKTYKSKGYQCIIITDHYTTGFFENFKKEIGSDDHDAVIRRFLKGYYAAKSVGDKIGLTVLCGAEVAVKSSHNHYLVYGLTEKDFYALPFLCELPNLEALNKTLPKYACIIQAHPFRNYMTICNPDNIFGYEVYNGGTKPIRNKLAKILANEYNKPITSGSDCHSVEATGKGGIDSYKKIINGTDFVNLLHNGEYKIIEPKL